MMFLKLLKHDFMDNYLPVILINVMICISVAIFAMFSNKLEVVSALGAIITILYVFLAIFTLFAIIRTFDRKLFSPEAYLTFSLPVSIDLILLSKILIAILWIVIDVAVTIGVLFLVNDGSILRQLHLSFIAAPLNSILFPISFVVTILFVLTLMNVFRISKYRFFIGLVIYWFLSGITGAIYAVLDMLINVQSYLIFFFVVQVITIIAFYYIIRYLIMKKLSF